MTDGDYSAPGDINDDLLGLVEDMSDEIGIPLDQAIKNIERQFGLDLAEIPDGEAEEFVEAFESGDASKIEDVLVEQGVPDDQAKQFRQMFEAQRGTTDADAATGSGDTRGNGDSPPETGSGGGGMSEQEVRQIVHDEVNNAVKQAVSSQQAAQQQAVQEGGGIDPQQQMVMQLASQFLAPESGGQMAELGQQFQKEAMQSFIRDMNKPDLGDMLEMKYYEEALGSDVVEEMMADWMPEDANDEDENSVMGMFPMDDDSEDEE